MEHYSKSYIGQYSYLPKEVVDDPDEVILDGPDFQYKLNSLKFRSDEFEKLEKNNVNILFAGCSQTYGEGLPLLMTWPKLLLKKINNDIDNTKDFNIAYRGASIHAIVRNIFAFINNYGKPDYLFVLFPGTNRDLQFSQKDNFLFNAVIWTDQNIPKEHLNYSKIFSKEYSLFHTTTLIYMLEEYCNVANIKLIWSTWYEDDDEFYKSLDFENYVCLSDSYDPNSLNKNNLPYWDFARDNWHIGGRYSVHISNMYYNELIRRKNEKQN